LFHRFERGPAGHEPVNASYVSTSPCSRTTDRCSPARGSGAPRHLRAGPFAAREFGGVNQVVVVGIGDIAEQQRAVAKVTQPALVRACRWHLTLPTNSHQYEMAISGVRWGIGELIHSSFTTLPFTPARFPTYPEGTSRSSPPWSRSRAEPPAPVDAPGSTQRQLLVKRRTPAMMAECGAEIGDSSLYIDTTRRVRWNQYCLSAPLGARNPD
jgi:hypothetical protein